MRWSCRAGERRVESRMPAAGAAHYFAVEAYSGRESRPYRLAVIDRILNMAASEACDAACRRVLPRRRVLHDEVSVRLMAMRMRPRPAGMILPDVIHLTFLASAMLISCRRSAASPSWHPWSRGHPPVEHAVVNNLIRPEQSSRPFASDVKDLGAGR